MWYCGVDIGTTHLKVVGIGDDGTLCPAGRVRTPVREVAGQTFHDGATIWAAVQTLICEYAAGVADDFGPLAGLAVAALGQEESFAVDVHGDPVSASRAWWQSPSTPALDPDTREFFDSVEHYGISGLRYRSMQSPERLAALRSDPGSAAMRWWVDFGSFITHRLTGEWVSAANQITHSQLFDVTTLAPHQESFDRLGVDPALFAPVAHTGAVVGAIDSASLPGVSLTADAAVYVGGHDQVLGALSASASGDARAFDAIGTSEYVMALGRTFTASQRAYDLGIDIEHAWVAGDFLYGFATPSGKILQTVARLLHGDDFEAMLSAASVPALTAPGFDVRIVGFDDAAHGLFDLTAVPGDATPEAVTAAVLDRLAERSLRVIREVGAIAGTPIDEITLMGSLFANPAMVAHRRRVWDIPLSVSDLAEPVATGAATVARTAHCKGGL